MFERYTEKARRSIFFARYEASVLGTREIEPEHLLLGILKADGNVAQWLLAFHVTDETIRKKIAQHRPAPVAKVSTSVDLPVSHQTKRAMAYGAEEMERQKARHIEPGHLLLGLLREDTCLAAEILLEAGITAPKLRRLAGTEEAEPSTTAEQHPARARELFRDLTEAAAKGELTPLAGREPELRRAIQILSRRIRNNVAFIGEPGVGKTALIEGLAQHLHSGIIAHFAEHRILQTDAASLFPVRPGSRAPERADEILRHLPYPGQTLLSIEGLFDLALARFDWGVTEAWHVVEFHISGRGMQCIATGTPAGLEATLAKAPDLARSFEIVMLAEPQPEEAVRILERVKSKYEAFHLVSFAPGAIEMAVYASGRFLPQRSLPDRALDLLDEAAARVRVRRQSEPADVLAVRKQVRKIERDMEDAIARHDFNAARQFSDMERVARETLRVLLEHRQAADPNQSAALAVTLEDIEQVVADRIGAPVSAIRDVLAKKGPGDLEEVIARLASRIPIEANPWLPMLAAYIARGSDGEIEGLLEGIRAARSR